MACISAHVALPKEDRDLATLREALNAKPARLLTLQVEVEGAKPEEAVVDGGSQLNLISAVFAKERGLKVEPLPDLLAEGVSGDKLTIYGTANANMLIQDSRGRTEVQLVPLVVCDLRRYKVYLGLPWIDSCDPKINYASRRVLFRGKKYQGQKFFRKIGIEDATDFEKSMRDPSVDVYACLVGSVSHSGPYKAIPDQLPPQYAEFVDVASEEDSTVLPEHGHHDLAINLVPDSSPPHRPLYNLSQAELVILRKYLDEYLARGWIRESKSPAGAPILFVKKKDGSLRLCVDYRGLNKITIKNRHPLPLIMESLDRLARAKFYTKIDAREAYHRIRIREGDEWKTAFRTRYGHFEYTVMPFGLTNAPAQFQAYINETLAGLIDVSCIVYLDDILVFSDTEEDHVAHVKEVLQRLRNAKLYIKLSKCEWHTQRTEFLGYIVEPNGVSIDPERIKTIREWPTPSTVHDIRVFIGFMNYYRRFIQGFSKLALPLTIMTQKGPGAARAGRALRKEESVPLDLSEEALKAFQLLKNSFLDVPILAHFERDRRTKVEVDASGGAISGILSQYVPEGADSGQWRPVDFYSRKLIAAEYNYDTHDQELLAIVKSLEHWRHYLEGIHFEILTDHQNLKWFMETKTLNHRQVRSYLVLSRYDFVLNHRPGNTNPADGPSRRPDYMAEAQKPNQKYNEAFVQPMRDILSNSRKQSLHVLAVAEISALGTGNQSELQSALAEFKNAERTAPKEPLLPEEESMAENSTDNSEEEEEPENGPIGPRMDAKHRVVLDTDEAKADAMKKAHDDPTGGHFGAKRTREKLLRYYVWKGLGRDVDAYCKDCLPCRRSTPARHRPYGLLAPLPPPTRAWEQVTMDFITELPPSSYGGVVYDAILVVVCRLTKMAHYIPARGDWDGTDLAQAWIREIIRLHGIPEQIISDRGPLMNAKHWKTFQYYLNSRRVLSSAYHPQTDGQTERQNQTLEQYLRCYCTLEQDDWALWIGLGEFAYNDSEHATIKTTPFRAYYGQDPRGAEWPSITMSKGKSALGLQTAAKVISVQKECRKNILLANAYQKEYADKKRLPATFKIGDQVLVSTRHMKSARPKRKLDWKYVGPGTIVDQYGPSAYKVDLPGLGKIHPVFHASLLEPYSPSGSIPHPEAPTVDTLQSFSDDVYEVDRVLERRQSGEGQWEYLVSWKGYPQEENSWEPAPNLSASTLKKFWKDNNIVQKRKKGVRKGRGRPSKKEGSEA
jgi:hypothetical protein